MRTSSLPAHQERVRSAIFSDLPSQSPITAAVIESFRARLVDGTRAMLTDRTAADEVGLNRHRLPRALRCPSSALDDSPFQWTATFANRSLGIQALESVVRRRIDIPSAIRNTIAAEIESAGRLGQWLGAQTPPERAATAAAATTWTNRAYVAVPWRALGRFSLNVSTWYRPLGKDSRVTFCGRTDAELHQLGATSNERVLLLLGLPDRDVIGLDVLTRSLEVGRAPLRHVTVHAGSGNVTVTPIDYQLLTEAVECCLAGARILVDLAEANVGPTQPGSYCSWCDKRHACHDGAEWIATQPPLRRDPDHPTGSIARRSGVS